MKWIIFDFRSEIVIKEVRNYHKVHFLVTWYFIANGISGKVSRHCSKNNISSNPLYYLQCFLTQSSKCSLPFIWSHFQKFGSQLEKNHGKQEIFHSKLEIFHNKLQKFQGLKLKPQICREMTGCPFLKNSCRKLWDAL